jgi:predicted 2-oxoglutarate/Fe(II)-dependent dioxygenase YbiX
MKAATQATIGVGDPMPRVTLPSASGELFDSSDPATAGLARVYWIGAPPEREAADQLANTLGGCETLLHLVMTAPSQAAESYASCLIDKAGELGRAFAATGPLAILVDPAGRVADVLPAPTPDAVIRLVTALYDSTSPQVVQAKAPVLLIERVAEPALCRTLIDYWQGRDKLANTVGSESGNVANADVKRRQDVQLDDPKLFVQLRDCLVRRVLPAMTQAFHARINVIEAPMIGCYPAVSGGWFRAHRDNTSRFNAHRQYALSLNLNGTEEYDGGAVRFPEYGRELYRPSAGAGLVFSCSLLHEATPVTRGRRMGAFTFLSATGPAPMAAPRQASTGSAGAAHR